MSFAARIANSIFNFEFGEVYRIIYLFLLQWNQYKDISKKWNVQLPLIRSIFDSFKAVEMTTLLPEDLT
jgi:hypothetical protein